MAGFPRIPATPTTPTTDAGLLLLDKPAGLTSHDVVARVRRATGQRRVGHAGTLDPFATGLLVVLIGRGTRLIPYVDGEPKVYDATIRFGAETDTDDVTGHVVRRAPAPNEAAIAAAVTALTGSIEQLPPAYSAKQVDGVRAYAAARRGTPLTLTPARVTVHSWELLDRAQDDLRVRITCAGGTYIRALARDLGRLTASAAHLAALRRVKSGAFDVARAASLDALDRGALRVSSLLDAIPGAPRRVLEAAERARVLHGNAIEAREEQGVVALVDDQQTLIAVARRDGVELRPRVVLADA